VVCQSRAAQPGAAEAIDPPRDQDAALSALDHWLAQYEKIAKVALSGKPELLEKIGVLKRSVKTAAHRAASNKAAATRAMRKVPPQQT
jgi:hypothetical protein